MDRLARNSGRGVVMEVMESQESAVDHREVSPYKFLTDAYTGMGGFLGLAETYLTNDTTEQFFVTRKKLSNYNNELDRYITAQYMRVYTDQKPVYDTNSASLADMLKNIDRRGSGVDDMKKYATAHALLHGTCFLASGHDGVAGKTPWIVAYTADQFNAELSESDEFSNVTKYVFTVKPKTYDVYTSTLFQRLYDDADNKKITGMTVIKGSKMRGMVVSPVRAVPSFGEGVLPFPRDTYAIARLSLGIFEMESRLIQLFTKQLFSRLIIRGDVDGIPEGVTNGVQVSENGGVEMLSPDPAIAGKYIDRIGQLYGQLYEHMRDGGVIAVDTGNVPESGKAKTYTFLPVNAALLRGVAIAEDIDTYIVWAHNFWLKSNAALEVQYKREYAPKSPVDALAIRDLWGVVGGGASKRLKDAVLVQVLDVLGYDPNTNAYADIRADIEAAVDEVIE